MPDHLKGKELKLNEYETYGRKSANMTIEKGTRRIVIDGSAKIRTRLHLGRSVSDLQKPTAAKRRQPTSPPT
jgi:hypothetical protein